MDQATLNQYFEESGAGLLADHADDVERTVGTEAGHKFSETDHHGPLDLLLTAISKPSIHQDTGEQGSRYQDESAADRHNSEMRPEDILHEEDVFLRYDPEDISQHPQQQDASAHREGTLLDQIDSNEVGEGEQTGNSIQGLLAASRMISADAGDGDGIASEQNGQHAGQSEVATETVTTPPVGSRRINPNPMKRRATSPPLSDLRRAKITRMFAATIGPSGSRVPEQQMSFSTITIMHGHIAQKSYGKEKRFLCPPPVVRMTGNISDTIETTVFKLVNADVGEDIPVISNTQGVRLDMLERDLDARAHLREGISFPGLYASRTGKAKGLRLRLDVFQPGGTLPREQDDEIVDPIEEMFDSETAAEHKNGNADGEDIFALTDLAAGDEEHASTAVRKSEHEKKLSSPAEPGASSRTEAVERQNASQSGGDQVPLEIQDMIRNDTEGEEPSESSKQLGERDKRFEYTPEAGDDAEAATLPNQEDDRLAGATGLVEDFNRFQISDRPWATFEASGIQIVSKPSKQTIGITKPSKNSKAIGIRIGDPFALWSRVSAQTVMTRYLYVDIDRGLLVGRNADWSAWVMDVVRRGEPPEGHPRDHVPDPDILTYGSIVILRDIQTQYRTEPLLLCKVINGAVYLHDYGPVSELHRIAFAKTVPHQGRWYLRSPMIERVRDKRGPRSHSSKKTKQKKEKDDLTVSEQQSEGYPPGSEPKHDVQTATHARSNGSYGSELPEAPDSRVAPQSTSSRVDGDLSEEKPGLSPALYSAPQIKLEEGDSGLEEREFLDDYLTWTISGITEHNFTFFEGRHEIGDYSTVFKFPLTPMPEILEAPVYNDRDNTITMAVTNYFYDDDNVLYRDKPLYLYLGAIGPLRVRTYQSIAPEDNWELVDKEPHKFPAIASDGGPDGSPETRPYSAVPRNVEHTVLVISCPDPLDMWNATQIERERYERKAQIELLSHSALAAEDGVDDHVHLPILPPFIKSDQDKKKKKKSADHDFQPSLPVSDGPADDPPLPQRSGNTEMSAPSDEPPAPEEPAGTSEMQTEEIGESTPTAGAEVNVQSAVIDEHHTVVHDVDGQTGEVAGHDLPINHFTQAEFAQHDLQQPNFGQDGTDGQPDHQENEITREMVENLVRQAQLQEHDGDLSAYTGLNPFSAEGFNMDDQHQIALLAAQAARSQVDSILHSDMTYVQGVATDIGIFTARALEAAAQAAQSGSDMLDPHAILAQHQATLADATQLQDSNEAHLDEVSGPPTDPDLDLANLAGMDMTGEIETPESGPSSSKQSKGKRSKKPSKEKRPKVVKEKPLRGGPKRPRTVPPAPTLVESPLQSVNPPLVKITKRPFDGILQAQGHIPRSKQLGGSSLPLLFLRQSDNTGYHTSKNLIVNRAEQASGYIWDIRIQ